MKLNEKLDILLTRNNYRRVEFAEKIGITYRAFAYYMSNTRKPRKSVLIRIANELGVTPEFLMNDKESIKLTHEEKFIRNMTANGKDPADAAKFLSQSKGLFAGNSLSEKDKSDLMKCLSEIYYDSRKGNK